MNTLKIQMVKIFMVLGVSWGIITCGNQGKVDKSEADANLVLGFVAGQQTGKNSLKNSQIEIRGSWEQYSCFGGDCFTSGSPVAHVFIYSEPGTNRGLFYQENPPTCFDNGGCTTPQFAQFASFFPADRSIESFSNSEKRMLTKNNRTIGFSQKDKFSYILWGTLEGETYTCDLFQNKNTAEEALQDLNSKIQSGTVSTDPAKFKTTGCNGFGWYLWKKRQGVL